jgi:phosphoglycolate phosphatase
MKNKVKAIIFDFDGTIANTMPFLTKLAVELMKERYGISSEEAKKKYLETAGLDFATQIEIIFPGHPSNSQVATIFEAKKLDGIFRHPIFPDVIETLIYLRRKKIRTFICSSTKEEIVMKYCKLNKIDTLVDDIFGYREGFGKYEQLDFIFRHLNLDPTSTLFIGDSLKDCDFARRKGINFIGISGIFKREDFQRKKVPTIDTLSDIIEMLDCGSEDL